MTRCPHCNAQQRIALLEGRIADWVRLREGASVGYGAQNFDPARCNHEVTCPKCGTTWPSLKDTRNEAV
jgi:Zn ribbon nucleic-acid-binding protein